MTSTGSEAGAILVTGSAGFIAEHVTTALRERFRARTIIGLDTRETRAGLCDSAVRADIVTEDLEPVLRDHRVDTIVHLAALCKEPGFPWREYFEVNSRGTDRLLDAASACGVRAVVFTSTMMVFAAGPERRAEDDLCDPDTAYGTSKLLAERSIRHWQSADPLRRVSIIRPGVVFGPGDYGNMTRLIKAVRRRLFAYMGRSDTVKGCIYVRDLAELVVDSVDSGRAVDVIHAVYPEPTTIKHIVNAIASAWGVRRSPLTVPYTVALSLASLIALADPLGRKFAVHPRRIQKLYNDTNISTQRLLDRGWRPRYSLEDAFRDWRTSIEREVSVANTEYDGLHS